MPDAKNKVHYDLTNVHVASVTDGEDGVTFGTPKRLVGAVSMDLSAQDQQTVLRADGVNYYVFNGNQGYEGDMTVAMVPDWFKAEYLGQTLSSKDKVLVENAVTGKAKPFALLFEFLGDAKNTQHVLYNCLAARPSVTGENNDNQGTPDTEAMTLTVSPLLDGRVKASTTDDTPDEVRKAWTTKVWTADSV
jgi:phi13 family phage major tail protein